MNDRSAGPTNHWKRHTIPTSVGPLAVWERGTGSALVLRHGIFFDHRMWATQAGALAKTHRVILIDAPGHGESGDVGRAYSLADDARATLEVLDHRGIDTATLVGHSWGGMSAVRTALAAPQRVSGLALIDTPLEPSSPLGRLRYGMLRALVVAVGAPPWYGAQVATAMFSQTSRRDNPDLTSQLQAQLAGMPRMPLARAMSAVLVHPDKVLARLGELNQPIMVLAGDEDYVLPPTTVSALTHLVPQASIATIPGMHVLPLEQPAETLRRIQDFLVSRGL
jgi:3-oxoadipate enol-lactonase